MKKSEMYHMLMLIVVGDQNICAKDKLEIVERLMADKQMALMVEEYEAKKAEEDEKW